MSEKQNTIVSLSFEFAIHIVNTYKVLTEKSKEYVMSKQLLRSGTAIGALAREASNAESKPDFIHKLGMAQKECDETMYWIDLLIETKYLGEEEGERLIEKATSLLKMIRSAIITTKSRYSKNP